ncbi:MAG: 2-phosphosulfolactate phosphatase [Bacteroidia bacterium]
MPIQHSTFTRNSFETLLTPALLPLYDMQGKTVVVIDILRATSSICVGFCSGATLFRPVAHPDQALALEKSGFVAAAERNGQKLEGFSMGNSPFDYLNTDLKNKQVAITTTNGTRCLHLSYEAAEVIIGSFLNLKAVADYCKKQNRDVIAFCAGWKDKFNLEDTLFAGALAQLISDDFKIECDSTLAAMDLYDKAKVDLSGYIKKASHAQRFERLGIEKDIDFCMQQSIYDFVPRMVGDDLII